MFKLLGLSPLSDAGQTEAMVARGQNSKPETKQKCVHVGSLRISILTELHPSVCPVQLPYRCHMFSL